MNQSQNITLYSWQIPSFQYNFAHQTNATYQDIPEQPHIHDCYEIYVNVCGEVSFLVNNNLYPVRTGDIIITRPGDVHICVYPSDVIHERFCFWINCAEDSPLLSFANKIDFANYIHFPPERRNELLNLMYLLKDAEATAKEPERSAYIFKLLMMLSEGKQTLPKEQVLPKSIQQVLDYIQENFPEIHCVEDIVEITHISGSTLNRWFRKYLQLSPYKYLEALKLSYAQKLLLDGCSVTEASDRSGFTDCSRFIAIFKKKFGITPLKYKKNAINNDPG